MNKDDNEWLYKMHREYDQKHGSSDNFGNKVFLTILLIIGILVVLSWFAPETPNKTAIEMVGDKIDKGQELNWLDKKVLNEHLNK
jgi:hypothetical protein